MNNGLTLTLNEGGAKGFPHRKTDESKGEDEEKFFVEKVIKVRLNKKGKEEFLVKWVGYPLSQATWEPSDHLSGDEVCKYLFILIHTIA